MKVNYPNLYIKVYKNPKILGFLRGISTASVAASVVSVGLSLLMTVLGSGWLSAIKLAAILAIPFAVVSLLRKWINLGRPCEIFDFNLIGISEEGFKRGCSFPSRHVFSGFLIAVALLPGLPVLGGLLLLLSTALAISRVLLGMHFIRDVVAGAVIGVLSAVIGLVIFGI